MSKTLAASVVIVFAVAVFGATSLWRSGQQLRSVSATFAARAIVSTAAPEAAPLPRSARLVSGDSGDVGAQVDRLDSSSIDAESEPLASVADVERFAPIETAGEHDALALLRTLASDPDPDVRGEAAALIDLYGTEQSELMTEPVEID